MNFVLPANLGKTNGMQNFVANHVISLHDVSQIQYHRHSILCVLVKINKYAFKNTNHMIIL